MRIETHAKSKYWARKREEETERKIEMEKNQGVGGGGGGWVLRQFITCVCITQSLCICSIM